MEIDNPKPGNLYIDQEKQEIRLDSGRSIALYSPEGFRIISKVWLKVGWDQKHPYSFTWLGRPIIQIPDDAFRIQEVIYAIKPDVIIETGVAHGGSLIFYASICGAMGKGRIIGIDIEIRPHNRKAIESHELIDRITLIEKDSTSGEAFAAVLALIKPQEKTLIILDSCHTYDHVLKELQLYSSLVTAGSYIVATDGSQEYLHETPRAKKDYPSQVGTWSLNNPKRAAEDFVKGNAHFKLAEPPFPFNEGSIDFRVTHWPSAYIQRV